MLTRTLNSRDEVRFAEPLPAGRTILQRVGVLAELPVLLRELGRDPAPLIETAGLSLEDFSQPDNRVPFEAVLGLLARCREATGMEDFTLRLGRRLRLEHFGWLGRRMRSAPTVGHALRLFAALQYRHSDAGAAFLLAYQGVVSLGYLVYRNTREDASPAHEVAMMMAANILRELCGPAWTPGEVLFARSIPAQPARFQQAFGCPVRFDNDHSALRFSARWMDVAPVTAETARAHGEPGAESDLRDPFDRLHRTVRLLLVEGRSTGDDLARILALNRRTLNRRLRARGTTFRQVLDEVRYDTARQLLAQTNVPIEEISAALCYSEVSAFTHAFRRWSSTTPGQFRAAARRRRTLP